MTEQDYKDAVLDSAWTLLEREGMHITSVQLWHACNHEYSLEECTEWMRQADERLDAMKESEETNG